MSKATRLIAQAFDRHQRREEILKAQRRSIRKVQDDQPAGAFTAEKPVPKNRENRTEGEFQARRDRLDEILAMLERMGGNESANLLRRIERVAIDLGFSKSDIEELLESESVVDLLPRTNQFRGASLDEMELEVLRMRSVGQDLMGTPSSFDESIHAVRKTDISKAENALGNLDDGFSTMTQILESRN